MFQDLVKSNKSFLFITIFLASFFSLKFVVDIKSLIFVFLSFSFLLHLFFEFSLKEIIFFVIILSFSFDKGIRGWNFTVVSEGREAWMSGFDFYYGLSIRTIATLSLFLLNIPDFIKFFKNEHGKKVTTIFWILISFLSFAFLSTVFSSDYFLSLFGFLRLVQAIFILFITAVMLQSNKLQQYFFISSSCLLIFTGTVSLLQYLNQGPLGWFLEDAVGHNNLGFFTSDGDRLYRTSGLIGHPTFFASFVSMLLPVLIGYSLQLLKDNKKNIVTTILVFTAILMGLFSIYTTYVRSSWMVMVVIILGFILFLSKNSNKELQKNIYKYKFLLASLSGSFLLFFGKIFLERLKSSISFLSSGSGVVRISLIKEAIVIIKEFPFFGVGLNLGPRAMIEQSILSPELRGFMFPVHSTFFLFFSELGIPAGVLFILLLFFILFFSFKIVKEDMLSFGIWMGVIAFILNAQVHTLFNHDPSFDLLFILLGFLTFICKEKKLQ